MVTQEKVAFRNPEIEMMPRDDLKGLQEVKLRRVVKYVNDNAPFWQKRFKQAGISPDEIKTLADLEKLPLITRADLQNNAKETGDPFGEACCLPSDEIPFVFSPEFPVSGEPVYLPLSIDDMVKIIEAVTRQWAMLGIGGDIVIFQGWSFRVVKMLVSPGGCSTFVRNIESVGGILNCQVFPFDPFTLLAFHPLWVVRYFKDVVFFTTVPLLEALGEIVTREGLSKKNLSLKKIIIRGTEFPSLGEEKGLPTAERRGKYEQEWGLQFQSMLDASDCLFYATDCSQRVGLHVWEDMYIVEAIDEKTGKSVAPGEIGKLTITNLFAEAMPLIRYKTDLDVAIDEQPCACGRTHARIIPQGYK
jgi:phenylacetate-CoA ligase